MFDCFVDFKMVKYIVAKYIAINGTKTFAEKCTECSALQSKIIKFVSCLRAYIGNI